MITLVLLKEEINTKLLNDQIYGAHVSKDFVVV